MKEQFVKFIAQPGRDTFLALRQAVFDFENFDPYSGELDEVNTLMVEGEWIRVVQIVTENLSPNHLLSPRAHLNLGFAHHKLGREKEGGMERMIYSLLIDGIKSTGDGTRESPYLVSRTSDEHDLVEADGLTFAGQALVSHEGRDFDVISTGEGDEIWFDITDLKEILDRKLGFSQNE